jgi:hypothetical protein
VELGHDNDSPVVRVMIYIVVKGVAVGLGVVVMVV